MSNKLPPLNVKTSPITVPNILTEFMPLPTPSSIRQSPIMFDHKTSKSNITKLAPIKNNSSKEKETPRTVIGSSSNKSMVRPDTASIYGRKGGRKTRKAKKSKKTRKNRKSKSKRKTRRTRRK